MAAPGFSRGFLSLFSLSFLFCFFHFTLSDETFHRARPVATMPERPAGQGHPPRSIRSVHPVVRGQGHPFGPFGRSTCAVKRPWTGSPTVPVHMGGPFSGLAVRALHLVYGDCGGSTMYGTRHIHGT